MPKRETRDGRRETHKSQHNHPLSSAINRLPSAVTILAFDYGTSRIGVAVGQTATCTAQELPIIKAVDGIPNADQLTRVINEWQPQLLVVGLPLNMDDSESELSQRARKFANRLRENFLLRVELMDERLSTFSAQGERLNQNKGSTSHQQPLDSVAARLILESWFNR